MVPLAYIGVSLFNFCYVFLVMSLAWFWYLLVRLMVLSFVVRVMASKPHLPNPNNPQLVGTIEAMIVAMQQQNANMVNQHNLVLHQMESAKLAAEVT